MLGLHVAEVMVVEVALGVVNEHLHLRVDAVHVLTADAHSVHLGLELALRRPLRYSVAGAADLAPRRIDARLRHEVGYHARRALLRVPGVRERLRDLQAVGELAGAGGPRRIGLRGVGHGLGACARRVVRCVVVPAHRGEHRHDHEHGQRHDHERGQQARRPEKCLSSHALGCPATPPCQAAVKPCGMPQPEASSPYAAAACIRASLPGSVGAFHVGPGCAFAVSTSNVSPLG